jgi:hypothetical protein
MQAQEYMVIEDREMWRAIDNEKLSSTICLMSEISAV